MKTGSTFNTAFEAIGRNLMRSALTSLGIIIGVAAVIVMMAIGAGARKSIEAQVSSLGTNVITVMAGSMNFGGVRLGQGATSTLTAGDATAITTDVRGVSAVSPSLNMRTQVLSAMGNWQTQVQGVGAALPSIRSWPLESGSFFSTEDVTRTAKVAVLGSAVRDQLFGAGSSPLGETIRINNQPFVVVGVLTRKGQTPMGQDQDDTVMVPWETMQKRLMGVTYLSSITVALDGSVPGPEVSANLGTLLRQRHKLTGPDDDFTLRSAEEMASVLTSTTTTMSYLLASVAAVSLIVGGIGIMNIMLVSVTERTKEIGLRRALGAKRTDVLSQFLIEALALSLGGGLTGVAVGIGTAYGLSALLHWTTAVSTTAVLMSFGFAASIGVVFGFVPARRAAALNPLEALRYE